MEFPRQLSSGKRIPIRRNLASKSQYCDDSIDFRGAHAVAHSEDMFARMVYLGKRKSFGATGRWPVRFAASFALSVVSAMLL